MSNIEVVSPAPMPRIVGINCCVLDPESDVPLNFHKLSGYSVDLFTGETKATFASYFTEKAMLSGKAIAFVTFTINSSPMRGIDPDAWIYSLVAYPPVVSSENLFNGATPIFEELSNV